VTCGRCEMGRGCFGQLQRCKDADAVRASALLLSLLHCVFIELFGVYLGYALWEFSVAESYMESIEGMANNTHRSGR